MRHIRALQTQRDFPRVFSTIGRIYGSATGRLCSAGSIVVRRSRGRAGRTIARADGACSRAPRRNLSGVQRLSQTRRSPGVAFAMPGTRDRLGTLRATASMDALSHLSHGRVRSFGGVVIPAVNCVVGAVGYATIARLERRWSGEMNERHRGPDKICSVIWRAKVRI